MMRWHLLLLPVVGAIPSTPHFFAEQRVDHFSTSEATFSQRYYSSDVHFKGPGYPIFVVIGGEGAVPPSTGLFYPFVVDDLAAEFSALVVQPEHRFYGVSLPFGERSFTDEHLNLMTAEQALADTAHFALATQRAHNCSAIRGTQGYCPIVTVGGSYPGWLSAMMRLRYPAVVDMAYSASAPTLMYAQQIDQYEYYSVVARSMEKSVTGCTTAARTAFAAVVSALQKAGSKASVVNKLGICTPLPKYLDEGDEALFQDELMMVLMYSWADQNMGNWPPTNSSLFRACKDIVEAHESGDSPFDSLRHFLGEYAGISTMATAEDQDAVKAQRDAMGGCFDMSGQLPAGPNATISSGDWSGVGTGRNGQMWDYETCTLLVEPIGVNGKTDPFPPRPWSLDWMIKHCQSRFGVKPQPHLLAEKWGFGHLEKAGASQIVFTNGMNDGWSAGGVVASLSPTLVAVNIPDGAHHSDLSHSKPGPTDTPDVVAARKKVKGILGGWLAKIQL